MNDKNLIPNSERTPSERREIARKGGIASGKARREKADMRKLMAMMLEEQVPNQDITYAERITQSMLTIAGSPKMGGASVRAYQTIMHIMGLDEPEPKQDAIDALKDILKENKRNAERIQTDNETE
jgi:hypothetical protein